MNLVEFIDLVRSGNTKRLDKLKEIYGRDAVKALGELAAGYKLRLEWEEKNRRGSKHDFFDKILKRYEDEGRLYYLKELGADYNGAGSGYGIPTMLRDTGFPPMDIDYKQAAIEKAGDSIFNGNNILFPVTGDSMTGVYIHDGDILVCDPQAEPHAGDIIVAFIDGSYYVKRLLLNNGKVLLKSENPEYENIKITEYMNFRIIGVVIMTMHFHR